MILENVNWRVARYTFFMMLTSSGMWNASVGMLSLQNRPTLQIPKRVHSPAFLPSSFAMYFVTLASAFNMEPPSSRNPIRTLLVTTFFATAAIVGWPFALALSVPFVLEELFLYAGDIVPAADKSKWMVSRWLRFARSVATAALIFVSLVQRSAPCPADFSS
jgi:alpha-1,2-mannosyltransferase